MPIAPVGDPVAPLAWAPVLTRHVLVAALVVALVTGCAAGTATTGSGSAASPASGQSSGALPAATPTPPVSPTAPVRTVAVESTGGRVDGTDGREEVALGEEVVLRFVSDVDEQIHVHGYDHEAALPAGTPVEVRLTADIPGVFEVELHDAGKVLYQLRVS